MNILCFSALYILWLGAKRPMSETVTFWLRYPWAWN